MQIHWRHASDALPSQKSALSMQVQTYKQTLEAFTRRRHGLESRWGLQ
jgi:hypothetical protein